MAVDLEVVQHGDPGWDKTLKRNFDALNQDTGIIPLTIVGALTGLYDDNPPIARRINGQVHLTGGIKASANLPKNTLILSMPDNFLSADGYVITSCRNQANIFDPFPIYIGKDGMYISAQLGSGTELDFSGIIYTGKGA